MKPVEDLMTTFYIILIVNVLIKNIQIYHLVNLATFHVKIVKMKIQMIAWNVTQIKIEKVKIQNIQQNVFVIKGIMKTKKMNFAPNVIIAVKSVMVQPKMNALVVRYYTIGNQNKMNAIVQTIILITLFLNVKNVIILVTPVLNKIYVKHVLINQTENQSRKIVIVKKNFMKQIMKQIVFNVVLFV